VTDSIIRSTAVWFPPDVYLHLPVLLPWVVRDPDCRPRTKNGVTSPDMWGAPNAGGYFRDDNSLIKGIPKSLTIRGRADSYLDGAKLGSGFVACHIWRVVNHESLASRHPRLNSFVPNLVWLPRQIAKLSDREGSHVQRALQRTSWAIYRNLELRPGLREVSEQVWALIPEPPTWTSVDFSELHSFECTKKFLRSRSYSLGQVEAFLGALLSGSSLPDAPRLSGRYRQGLPAIPTPALRALHSELQLYT